MTDAKARLLQMIADEPHMAGGGLLKAVTKAQKVAKAAQPAKAATKVIEAPSVVIPSKLSDLKEVVRGKMGNYGARRVERAADEIPNLERMYREEALRQAFTGDNAKGLMTLNPADFEKYATPLMTRDRPLPNSGVKKENLPTDEYVNYLAGLNEYHDVPFLEINKQEYGLPLVPFISGHEGRHRNRAMAQRGEQAGLVQLLPRSELREPFSRRTQEEYLQALRDEMEMTGNRVKPQAYFDNFEQKDIKRPAIELPDIYAEGGDVHMAGGGRTPKYPWERYEQPKKVPEMRARQISPIAGAIKSGADYATQLIDKGPSLSNLVGNLVGAIPFVGPDMRKRMESSDIAIPTDFALGSNVPAEDYEYGQPMQYKKPGISTTSVPTKDVLEALKVSDLVGTPGLSKVAEDIGYGQTPDPLDLLDAASAAALGYGAIKGGIKGGRKAAGALSDLAKSDTGYKLAQKALEFTPAAQPMNIVKEPGGNWISGTVEQALKPLRKRTVNDADPVEYLATLEQKYGKEGAEEVLASGMHPMLKENAALNNWIDRNLGNYVKKQMATPNDPVRKLAEEGISHMPELDFPSRRVPESLAVKRMQAGQAPLGLGQSDAAKGWETATDYRVNVAPAKEFTKPLTESEIRRGFSSAVDTNPWLTKLDPDTPVFHTADADFFARDLGFDHIVDVLNQDLAAGRIRPEQLNKISMEQAVRRTYEFDQEMAKKMRETQAKVTEGMPVYKEYPEGYKWVELSQPKELPKGWSQEPSGAYVGPNGERTTVNPNYETLGQALKYEGDTMGHCVGGYCPDVAEGRSRIYSLRDAKGEPHVTVEVQPGKDKTGLMTAEELPSDVLDSMKSRNVYDSKFMYRYDEQTGRYLPEMGPFEPRIVQIKGKQNRAPKEDYLPFVQDFVKGGQWADVGDIQNTGLINLSEFNESPEFLQRLKDRFGDAKYATEKEIEDVRKQGMAAGGSVSDAKKRLLDMIAEEPHMAGGGITKLQKIAKAAKAAEASAKAAKVEHPLVFPRAQAKTINDIRPIAQRMADQMTGNFVKQNPKVTTNPAGKSRKQFERERSIPLETRNVVPERPAPDVNYEDYMGYGLVGVPGDPTMGGVAKRGSLEQLTQPTVELTRVGDITPDYPVPLFGGPRYGDDEKFWASNFTAAVPIQKNASKLADKYESPILAKYIKMGSGSENFALHNLDALLSIQRPEKLDKAKMAQLTEAIQAGSPKYGKFPGFTGFKDPADVLLQAQMDSNLRKHIAETLTKPTITDQLGLPNGLDVVAAITYPELRNLETGASGFSVGKMKPGAELQRGQSSHPTYDTDIPGSFLGRSRYPTPYEIAFPDTTAYARSQMTPGVQEFNMMKMLGPRERIDQQYIDEIKMYEQLMKQYTGKKKGGLAHSKKVKRHGNTVSN